MGRQNANGVLIMAGGTGGHIFPGLAVASALQANGMAVRWLGASGGMECERVPQHGIEIDTVEIRGLRGKGLKGWILLPFRLMKAVSQAMSVIGKNRPVCAISFGGYAAGPGGLAAKIRGVPVLVHEQNRVPGMTNKFLGRISRKILQAFPGTWPESERVETCGNPVRKEVVTLPSPAERMRDRHGPVRILVTGGSQGARALNQAVPEALKELDPDFELNVRHQTGLRDQESTRDAYNGMSFDAEVSAFIEDMAAAYGWADLVICRSGALTVSELAAAGLGAVLVPFPYAVDDHQTRNGEVLVEANAALMIQESNLDGHALANGLRPLLSDRTKLLEMAEAARSVAIPDSAERVARYCLEFAS